MDFLKTYDLFVRAKEGNKPFTNMDRFTSEEHSKQQKKKRITRKMVNQTWLLFVYNFVIMVAIVKLL